MIQVIEQLHIAHGDIVLVKVDPTMHEHAKWQLKESLEPVGQRILAHGGILLISNGNELEIEKLTDHEAKKIYELLKRRFEK